MAPPSLVAMIGICGHSGGPSRLWMRLYVSEFVDVLACVSCAAALEAPPTLGALVGTMALCGHGGPSEFGVLDWIASALRGQAAGPSRIVDALVCVLVC